MRIRCRPYKIPTALCLLLMFLLCVLHLILLSEKFSREEHETPKQDIPIQQEEEEEEKLDWHDYHQIKKDLERTGPGEQGLPVHLPPKEKHSERNRNLFIHNGYDVTVSDLIAYDRAPKDLRTPRCRDLKYRRDLPSVSIIIPFMKEHLSALVRTFVTAYIRAPPHLLKEIILADDFSQAPSLQAPLDEIVAQYPKVRVLRMQKRMGAIRVRQAAARNATGDVLFFLDAHTEAGINWLPPLLEPIMDNYRLVTCPFIDVVQEETFEHIPQDQGARGAFSWYLNYKRLPVPNRGPHNQEVPFESPIMAGGLFAITRKWFWEFGGYDTGLDIWGGEQYDLSFKIWMCGGRMIDIPCSRFGHIYKMSKPFLKPDASVDFLYRNYKRIIETWFDEYKRFPYLRQPHIRDMDAGDLTDAINVRKRLKCKSFDWFMKKVAFDITDHYALIPRDAAFGQVRCMRYPKLCLDFENKEEKGAPSLSLCKEKDEVFGSSQNLLLTWRGELTLLPDKTRCLSLSGEDVVVEPCNVKGNRMQYWQYEAHIANQLFHTNPSKSCLECLTEKTLGLRSCQVSSRGQQWKWNHFDKRGAKELLQLP